MMLLYSACASPKDKREYTSKDLRLACSEYGWISASSTPCFLSQVSKKCRSWCGDTLRSSPAACAELQDKNRHANNAGRLRWRDLSTPHNVVFFRVVSPPSFSRRSRAVCSWRDSQSTGSGWRQFPIGRWRCEQQRLFASQAVGGAAQVEDLAVMEEAVDDGHHEGGVTANHLSPVGQGFVGGNNRCPFLIPATDEFIEGRADAGIAAEVPELIQCRYFTAHSAAETTRSKRARVARIWAKCRIQKESRREEGKPCSAPTSPAQHGPTLHLVTATLTLGQIAAKELRHLPEKVTASTSTRHRERNRSTVRFRSPPEGFLAILRSSATV